MGMATINAPPEIVKAFLAVLETHATGSDAGYQWTETAISKVLGGEARASQMTITISP